MLQTKLHNILVHCNAHNISVYEPILQKYFDQTKMTDEDICRFLANAFNETGLFSSLRESMTYKDPARLKIVYPDVFVHGDINGVVYDPNKYVNNPVGLANLVYDSRLFKARCGWMQNTQNGDGFAFRGGGLFQTTGRSLYAQLAKDSGLDFVKNSDLIAIPENAVHSAIAYWTVNKLSSKATLKDVRGVISGGSYFGLAPVTNYYNKIKEVQ